MPDFLENQSILANNSNLIQVIFEAIPGNNLLLSANPPEFTILGVTEGYLKETGSKKEDLLRKGIFDAFPDNPDDRSDTGKASLRDSFEEVIKNKKFHELPTQRYEVFNDDGSFKEKYCNAGNSPVLDDEGNVRFIIHTLNEITHKVLAEKREEEIKLLEQAHNLFSPAPVGMAIITGPELIIALANDPLLDNWGKEKDVIGKPILEVMPEFQRMGLIQIMHNVMSSGDSYHAYESPATITRDGKEIVSYFNFVYQPYYREDQARPVGILMFANDVTDKITVKKELAEKEQSLALAMDIGELGIFSIDIAENLDNSQAVYSDRVADWFGLPMNRSTLEKIISRIHSDDQQVVYETIKHSLKNKDQGSHDLIYCVRHPHSNVSQYLRSIGQVQFQNDRPKAISGIIQDVTSQINATKKLKESEQRFSAAIQAIQGILWTNNAEGKMEGEQPGWAALTGQAYEEYQGFGWANVVHPEDAQATINAWNEAVKERKMFVFEHRIRMKNNAWGIFSIRAIPLMNTDNSIREWVGVHTEITERKRAEENIRESEERFRSLADQSPMIIYLVEPDLQATISYFNKKWLNYTGQSFEQAIGRAWHGIVHPEDLAGVFNIYVPAFKQRISYTFPAVRLKRFDGEYRWHLFKGNPRYLPGGDFIGFVGVGIDIHEQKLSEEAIKLSESELHRKVAARTVELESQKNLLNNILINSSNGISVTEMIRDGEGSVIDAATILANDAAVKYIGLPKDFYLTKTATELDPEIMSTPYGQTCLKTLATGEASLIQYFLELSGRWLELTISKMDEDHLIHIFTDVTQIKEAQLHLERKVEELRRSNENLEQFAYAASHDLKEPIRKITFFTDRLKNSLTERITEEDLRIFERMETASTRMRSLIDDLLSYSQVGIKPREVETVNMNHLISTVLDDLDLEIEEKGAKIVVEELFNVKGHFRQLQQAFQNLIANSLKYYRKDIVPYISVRYNKVSGKELHLNFSAAEQSSEFYEVIVSDNGIGFEQKDAERIFNVFTRLHGNTQFRGTGIGLSIVRKVIENHNGYISAESQPGEGAIFKVYLPAS